MFYPFKFEPIYKDYIWGGRNLEKYGKQLPPFGNVAESWEISCHPNGVSVISNGELIGQPLTAIIERYSRQILGSALPEQYLHKFPLLVKLIDANDKLSVQVHPNDDYARIHENGELGKNEMWYIISAKPGSKLVINLKPGTTKELFIKAIKNNTIETCLQMVEVSAGDVINIPAGLVHAIGEGIVLAEIQQSSDVTYRLFDYHRVDKQGLPRPLHIEKAFETIDFDSINRPPKTKGLELRVGENWKIKYLVANEYFAVELYEINGLIDQTAVGDKFFMFFCLEGQGEVVFNNGNDSLSLQTGESVFIPASLGEYKLKGKMNALKAYVPDLVTEILHPLRKAGFSDSEIYENIGGLK